MAKKQLTALDIAKWFINRTDRASGDAITQLKVQKLVYYAQAWHLALYGKPLFNEKIEAWTHGPVVRSVWKEYKNKAWEALEPHEDFSLAAEAKIVSFLDGVYNVYGKFGAKELEKFTHEETPWKQTRGSLPLEARCEDAIECDLMRDYYVKRLKKSA